MGDARFDLFALLVEEGRTGPTSEWKQSQVWFHERDGALVARGRMELNRGSREETATEILPWDDESFQEWMERLGCARPFEGPWRHLR